MIEQWTHFRRCHRCDHVNEAQGALVETCSQCAGHLAPFYFFDESKAMGMKSSFYSEKSKSRLPLEEYPPVGGLTAYWES